MDSELRFNFVECASQAYRFFWERRVDIARLAAPMLVFQILCSLGLVFFDLQGNHLREGLLLIPVYFFEGWVVAHLMVMALYSNAPKMVGVRSALPPLSHVALNIKASMILYVLTKLCLVFIFANSLDQAQGVDPEAMPAPSVESFLSIILLLGLLVWAFRFQWLFVPAIMGWHPFDFLKKFNGFSASLYLMGVCLLCLAPIILLMMVMVQFSGMVLGDVDVDQYSVLFTIILEVFRTIFSFLMSAIASVAVAYGVFSVYNGDQKKPSVF